MWRRTVLISINVLVLLIITGAIFIYLQTNQSAQVPAPVAGLNNENVENPEDGQTGELTNSDNKQATPVQEPKLVTTLDSQARLFVEKYGTYSSDYPYKNLQSVLNLVTDNYAATIQIVIEQGLSKNQDELSFYSVSTKVLSVEQIKNDGELAEVEILTQRAENYSRTDEPVISYKKIALTMKMVNNDWLVNSAKWITE